jgi:hypothetical protein
VDFILINPAAFTHTSVPPSLLLLRRCGRSDLRPWRQRLPTGPGGRPGTA